MLERIERVEKSEYLKEIQTIWKKEESYLHKLRIEQGREDASRSQTRRRSEEAAKMKIKCKQRRLKPDGSQMRSQKQA